MARKRRDGHGESADEPRPPKTVKLTLSVSHDTYRRFGIHAVGTGMAKNELFERMVKSYCNRFRLHDMRGQGGDPTPTAEGTDAA